MIGEIMSTDVKRIGAPAPQLAGTGAGNAVIVSEPEPMNVSTEMFHNVPVRIMRTGKEAVFPVVDIARGIGYDRKALKQLLDRNKDDFDEYFMGVIITPTKAGIRDVRCLNRDGVIALFMLLDVKRIKDKKKRDRIREFRKWAIETLGKVMDGIPVQPAKPKPELTLNDAIEKYLGSVEQFARFLDVPADEVREVALRIIEQKTGEPMEPYQKLLVRKPKPVVIDVPRPALPAAAIPETTYKDEGSAVREFVTECCLMEGNVSRLMMYRAYQSWCRKKKYPVVSTNWFFALVASLGLPLGNCRVLGLRGWSGISIKREADPYVHC